MAAAALKQRGGVNLNKTKLNMDDHTSTVRRKGNNIESERE